MANVSPDHVPLCMKELLGLLRRFPAGISEWALLKELQREHVAGFRELDLTEPLALYRSHFLLFHCLYRLRDELCRMGGERLQIHCLRIVLYPGPAESAAGGRSAVARRADPLQAFYLDLANLDAVDAAQVEAMLSDFRYRLQEPDGRRARALEVLGLDASAGREEIRRRYRQLAQRHHPDRGGDTATLQRLNEAMMVLAARR